MRNVTNTQATHARALHRSTLTAAILTGIGLAFAGAPVLASDDASLTWNGVTLYGTVDIGIAYQNHGAPLSQDFYPGLEYAVAKNSNKSITTLAPSGLSQSKIGLRGNEPLNDEFAFIFNVEMGFNPTSGKLADAPASLIHNNGVPLTQQTAAGDGARAGQLFNGPAFAGFSSKNYGTLSAGRNNTVLLDTVNKYYPMNASYAFSPLGYSGLTAGGGNTELTRLDDSLKYNFKRDWFRFAALYQFGKSDGSPGEAWQGNIGFDYAGFSVDGVYARKKDAISLSSLSAAQLATPGVPHDSLSATISDNESWTLAASYTNGPWKVSGGYEAITFSNPSLKITSPFSGLGGYYISFLNNTAFPRDKDFSVTWVGLKYNITKDFDITGAWYYYDQTAFGAVKCSTSAAGNCSGNEDFWSLRLDYRFNKRFDVYAGAMYSKVSDGLANGFLNDSTTTVMTGFRFNF